MLGLTEDLCSSTVLGGPLDEVLFLYVLGCTRILRSIHVLLSLVEVAAPTVDNGSCMYFWFLLVFRHLAVCSRRFFGMSGERSPPSRGMKKCARSVLRVRGLPGLMESGHHFFSPLRLKGTLHCFSSA